MCQQDMYTVQCVQACVQDIYEIPAAVHCTETYCQLYMYPVQDAMVVDAFYVRAYGPVLGDRTRVVQIYKYFGHLG